MIKASLSCAHGCNLLHSSEDVFDTVLIATGRYALTKQLNLEAAGVNVSVFNDAISN